MTQAKHTPGPWSVGGKYAHKTVLLNAKGESIASGGNNRSVNGETLEASLLLAAAAPELLEALENILKVASVRIDDPRITQWESARAAIAKATGGAA